MTNASYFCLVKNLLFLILILIQTACSNEQEKVVQLDDLVSGSKVNYDKKVTLVKSDNVKQISFFVNRLCDSLQIDKMNVGVDSSFTFLERFHPIKSDKVRFQEGDFLAYSHWKWGDSSKASQAFFNWLDQFGDKKQSIIVGDQVKINKSGFIVLLQDKSIVYLEFGRTFKPEHYLHKLTNCGFGKHWKYIIYQQPLKKTNWIDCISDTTRCPLYPSDEEKKDVIQNKKK
jgi:hypothetical protein